MKVMLKKAILEAQGRDMVEEVEHEQMKK